MGKEQNRCKYIRRWILDRKNGTGLIGKKVRIGPSFISAATDVVGGLNGYSEKFGDEEA